MLWFASLRLRHVEDCPKPAHYTTAEWARHLCEYPYLHGPVDCTALDQLIWQWPVFSARGGEGWVCLTVHRFIKVFLPDVKCHQQVRVWLLGCRVTTLCWANDHLDQCKKGTDTGGVNITDRRPAWRNQAGTLRWERSDSETVNISIFWTDTTSLFTVNKSTAFNNLYFSV